MMTHIATESVTAQSRSHTSPAWTVVSLPALGRSRVAAIAVLASSQRWCRVLSFWLKYVPTMPCRWMRRAVEGSMALPSAPSRKVVCR